MSLRRACSGLAMPLLFAIALATAACGRDAADTGPVATAGADADTPVEPAPAGAAHIDMAGAKRFASPQGYRIQVAPGFTMTPEEPCCDQAWPEAAPDAFMRIERIDDRIPLTRLREDMVLALSAVGPAVAPAQPPEPPGHEVELQLAADSGAVAVVMSIHRLGGARYRVTRHLPADAPAQAADAMQAMLGTLENGG